VQVVEQFLASKAGPALNGADRIVLCEHFAAVIDGVSTQGASVGRRAAELLCEVIQTLVPSLSASQAVASMTACLRAAQASRRALAASVVLYSAERREIWSVGDGQFLCGGVFHSPVLAIDRALGQLRAFVLEHALAEGTSVNALIANDVGRAAIEPFLALQPAFANARGVSAFAYGVINGDDVPERFVHVHVVPREVNEIVLASDGYPALKPTLDASERALADLLECDPLRMHDSPGTKGVQRGARSYDDRAYLRIRL